MVMESRMRATPLRLRFFAVLLALFFCPWQSLDLASARDVVGNPFSRAGATLLPDGPSEAGRNLHASPDDIAALGIAVADPATSLGDARDACYKLRKLGSRARTAMPSLIKALARGDLTPAAAKALADIAPHGPRLLLDESRSNNEHTRLGAYMVLAIQAAEDHIGEAERGHFQVFGWELEKLRPGDDEMIEVQISLLADPELATRMRAYYVLSRAADERSGFSASGLAAICPGLQALAQIAGTPNDPKSQAESHAFVVLMETLVASVSPDISPEIHGDTKPPIGPGDPARTQLLRELAAIVRNQTTSPPIRGTVIRSLCNRFLKAEEAADILYEMRSDRDYGDSARDALSTLIRYGKPGVMRYYVAMLSDPSPEIRNFAVNGIAGTGKRALPALLLALKDNDSKVRKIGINLSRMNMESDGSVVSALAILVSDSNVAIKTDASAALEYLLTTRETLKGIAGSLPKLVPAMIEAAKDPATRRSATRILKYISPSTPIPILSPSPATQPAG